jgi:hypothetical protein
MEVIMKDHVTRFQENTAVQPSSFSTGKKRSESRLWSWWYHFTAPSMPKEGASFEQMELFRRGRTGSQIILALYFLLIIAIPARFLGTNEYLLSIIAGAALFLTVATILNRLGMITCAGILVVLTFLAFPIINIVTTPGGLSMPVLPLFSLLVLPLLCTVSFLSPGWVFAIALVNILFTLLSLAYLPRTAELDSILAIAYAGVVTPILLSQILVAVVSYVWVNGTVKALLRADQAEELVKLERDLAHQAEDAAQQKTRLEESMHRIVETHMRIANGDLDARVPVTEGDVLWQIAGPLNNLLARAQGWLQEARQWHRNYQTAYKQNEELKNANAQLQQNLQALQQSIGKHR